MQLALQEGLDYRGGSRSNHSEALRRHVQVGSHITRLGELAGVSQEHWSHIAFPVKGCSLPFPQGLANSPAVGPASLPGARAWNPGLLLIDMVASAVIVLCL